MGTLTRKQREIQEREQMLLRVARDMLIEVGFASLSLDRLAEATEYSKGTIYQHFSSKEDLVAALAIQSSEQRLDLYLRATGFEGSSRCRALALIAADDQYGRINPHYFRSELIIRMANLDERVSEDRRRLIQSIEEQTIDLGMKLVRDAVSSGDLTLEDDWTVERVTFALFCQLMGAHTGMQHFCSIVHRLGITPADSRVIEGVSALMDGLNWKPLNRRSEDRAIVNQVMMKLFPEESSSDVSV